VHAPDLARFDHASVRVRASAAAPATTRSEARATPALVRANDPVAGTTSGVLAATATLAHPNVALFRATPSK
jgi:hypothetical protein